MHRKRRHFAPAGWALALALAVACSNPLHPGAVTTEELKPWALPQVVGNPIPTSTSEQVEMNILPGEPENNACHLCSFTNGLDPDDQVPQMLGLTGDPAQDTYIAQTAITSVYPPSFEGQGNGIHRALNQLLPIAAAKLQDTNADNINDTLDDIAVAFTPLPGSSPIVQHAIPKVWAKRFKTVYARYLAARVNQIDHTEKRYKLPWIFNELVDRGARTWCGMREAAKAQGGKSNLQMLHNALLSIFNDKFALGLTNSDLTLTKLDASDDPATSTKSTAENGAQAFLVPFAVGSEIAPVRGPLIPDFGALSHPMVWLTGDAEVQSDEGLMNTFDEHYFKDFQHTDIIAGKSYTGGCVDSGNMLLANLGFVQVYLKAMVGVTAGAVEGQEQIYNCATGQWEPTEASDGAAGKVLFAVGPGASQPNAPYNLGWPALRTAALEEDPEDVPFPAATGLPLSFHGNGQPCVNEIGDPMPFGNWATTTKCSLRPSQGPWPAVNALAGWEMPMSYGVAARWRNDDDRSFSLLDQVRMDVGLVAGGGINLVVVAINATASMSIGIASNVHTIFREQLDGVDSGRAPLLPAPAGAPAKVAQTSFTITSTADDTLNINPFTIGLDFKFDFKIFKFEWAPTILKFPEIDVDLAEALARQEDRLRVGEYSELKTAGGGLATYSHLPAADMGSDATFAAQPRPVYQCLADPTEYGSEPHPKPTVKTPSDPLPWGLCLYGPSPHGLNAYRSLGELADFVPVVPPTVPPYGADICSDHTWVYNFAKQDQEECLSFTLDYLCGKLNDTSDVSKVVVRWGEHVVAHLVQENHGEEKPFNDMWAKCITAFVPKIVPDDPDDQAQQDAAAYAMSVLGHFFSMNYIEVKVCDVDTLLPIDQDLGNGDPGCQDEDPITHKCGEPPGDLPPLTCTEDGCTPCFPNPLTGRCEGAPPRALTVDPDSVDLGRISVGAPASATVRLANTSATDVVVTGIFPPGPCRAEAAATTLRPRETTELEITCVAGEPGRGGGEVVVENSGGAAARVRVGFDAVR